MNSAHWEIERSRFICNDFYIVNAVYTLVKCSCANVDDISDVEICSSNCIHLTRINHEWTLHQIAGQATSISVLYIGSCVGLLFLIHWPLGLLMAFQFHCLLATISPSLPTTSFFPDSWCFKMPFSTLHTKFHQELYRHTKSHTQLHSLR